MKKRSKYTFRNEEFISFKAMKTYAYFSMGVGVKEKGYESTNDEILKEYELIRQERRLLCRKTYDKEENDKKWIKNNNLIYLTHEIDK